MGMQNLSQGSGPSNTRSEQVGGRRSEDVVDGLLYTYINLDSSGTHHWKQGTENCEGIDSEVKATKANEESSDVQATEVQEIMGKRICERGLSNLGSNFSKPHTTLFPCASELAYKVEPRSHTSQFGRFKEIVQDLSNTLGIDHFYLGTTFEEAMKHKEHTLAAVTDELIEESPAEDLGFTKSTEDVGYAQSSSFEAMKSQPKQVEEETVVVDTSDQKLMLGNNRHMQHKSFVVEVEKDDTTIQFASKTCKNAHNSKIGKKSEENISFKSVSTHFGKPLEDAAKSFGVSRSTFKRICRGLGIERWQPGKRRMGENISSKTLAQDTILAHTSQDPNKMTINATHDDRTIRFKLPVISGIVDLEDNVIKRLHFKRKRFSIQYQDDEGDWVLIACDKDVRECMEISRSLKKTTVRLLLDKPISHYAP